MSKILLIAGRTGGPIVPLLTISQNLKRVDPVIVGVKGGYEQKIAERQKIPILFLPEVKLRRPPTKKNPWTLLIYGLDIFGSLILLNYSILLSLFILFRQKPKLVLSAGSFLAVPIIYAAKIYNFFFRRKIKILVHQQDPLPGLANRLTVRFANLVSYVFDYTAGVNSYFARGIKIPNPINLEDFKSENLMKTVLEIAETRTILHLFFRHLNPEKPLLLVFGGASGAEKINDWLIENLTILRSRFNILHLTGVLQKKEYQLTETSGYLSIPELTNKEMKLALNVSDVVLCRAGLGSISELLYLQKPAYLVPIPNSHQELNAKLVEDYFYILNQDNQNQWVSKIFTTYPQFFDNIEYKSTESIETELVNYYTKIQHLVEKD